MALGTGQELHFSGPLSPAFGLARVLVPVLMSLCLSLSLPPQCSAVQCSARRNASKSSFFVLAWGAPSEFPFASFFDTPVRNIGPAQNEPVVA